MDKEKAKEYLDFLHEKYTEWYTQPKKRNEIADEIRLVADHWDDEIYIHLNQGRASGLFKHGFFESDIHRAFELLNEIVNEGKPRQKNKMYKIYSLMEKIEIPEEDVARKELRDYLLEKIRNGELDKGRITFKDDEDFDYFFKLTSGLNIDADGLLEEIVFSAFNQEG